MRILGLYDVSTFGSRVFGVGRDDISCYSQNQSTSQIDGSLIRVSADGVLNTFNSQDKTKFLSDRTYVLIGDDNKSISSFVSAGSAGNEPKPAIYSNCVVNRINRSWKVQVTGVQSPSLFVSIPSNASSEVTKLPSLPSGTLNSFESRKVYLVSNNNADFTVNANMIELEMNFNATTQSYEVTLPTNPSSLANHTFYFTIVTRIIPCRSGCIISNSNAKSHLKN